MYCKKCGKYNENNLSECKYCGHTSFTQHPFTYYQNQTRGVYHNDKSTSGFWAGFLFSLLGLAIGLLRCNGSYETETFLKGWAKGFIISIVLGVVLYFCIVGCATCAIVGRY